LGQGYVGVHQWGESSVVGGVAQWLERRSLTGELSLIYAWSMVGMWLLRW